MSFTDVKGKMISELNNLVRGVAKLELMGKLGGTLSWKGDRNTGRKESWWMRKETHGKIEGGRKENSVV